MMRNPRRNPELELQIFRNLPSEVIIDIISRLPIRTIGICKCVCKSWRDLLRSREFADLHFAKSVPGIVIGYDRHPENYKIFEFNDELGLERDRLHFNPVTKFDSSVGLPGLSELKGSAKGLIFFRRTVSERDVLYICNPITREYIELPHDGITYCCPWIVNFGFGVSKITGQFKVVRICHDFLCDDDAGTILRCTKAVCLVYTVGTGMWRSVAPNTPFLFDKRSNGVSLNGNLHWWVEGAFDDSYAISCFDLETEIFSTFSAPSLSDVRGTVLAGLGVLRDCLCVCVHTVYEIVIWLMKEYGDEKSWTKEFVIRKSPEFVTDDIPFDDIVYPIKLFRDGDILMAWHDYYTIYYSNKTTEMDMFVLDDLDYLRGEMAVMLHTSSFISLRSFAEETVSTF